MADDRDPPSRDPSQWVDEHGDALFRFAVLRVRDADLAADLVRSGVDLIVAVSSPAIRAAENATSTIPIVMVSGTDPVAGLGRVPTTRAQRRGLDAGATRVAVNCR